VGLDAARSNDFDSSEIPASRFLRHCPLKWHHATRLKNIFREKNILGMVYTWPVFGAKTQILV